MPPKGAVLPVLIAVLKTMECWETAGELAFGGNKREQILRGCGVSAGDPAARFEILTELDVTAGSRKTSRRWRRAAGMQLRAALSECRGYGRESKTDAVLCG